jgi:penicillin V acylase-like amidase (Ntn superfamily)
MRHNDQVLVGKNYDWKVEEGLIIVNKRGVSKTAFISTADNTGLGIPAAWTSKYGSITFTQYGSELSPGGMNEAGLVVESMGLFHNTPNRKYPEPDTYRSIERFIRAANMAKRYNPAISTSPIDYAFGILKRVSWGIDRDWQGTPYTSNTRWSIKEDPPLREIVTLQIISGSIISRGDVTLFCSGRCIARTNRIGYSTFYIARRPPT